MNVADLLTRQALATPSACAVIAGERAFRYAEFEALVWGLCCHLRDAGLRSGDVVGIHLNDTLTHLASVLALARSGMVSVAITSQGAETEAGRNVLTRTGAAAVVDADRRLDWGVATRIELAPDQLLALTAAPDDDLRCDDPYRILHYKTSSGTTGSPKIVAATHAGMMASIERETVCVGYLPGERYMTPVSLRYDGPRRRYLACLASGGTAVMPPNASGMAAMVDTIDRHDVRHFSCVPSQAYELAAAAPPGRQRFPQMRCFRLSAGPSDVSLHKLLRERLSSNVLVSYGCTELGPLTVAPPDLVASWPQTVGRPMPGIDLQIVSAADEVQPPDGVGLIRIRAEGMPHGYEDDAEATATYFKNGWFYPGDMGKINQDGLLFHMGRADGMMVMDGINIYPAEIEQAMLSHPAVRDAVAMPLKHRIANEVPVCAVVLNEGERISVPELMRFAKSRLGSHRPRRVAVLEAIPRNEHGKVLRHALRQALLNKLGFSRMQRPAGAPQGSNPERGVLGQLSLAASVSFDLPAAVNLPALDAWLNEVLQLDVSDPPASPGTAWIESEWAALEWLWRALLLTRQLLQTARLPVLDMPRVIACGAHPMRSDAWQARIGFARVDEMSSVAYDIAFMEALQLNAWAMAHAVDAKNVEAFYAMVEHRVTSRLRPILPLGKSTLPVLRAAYAKSIPFMHLGAGVFQLGWGFKAQHLRGSVSVRDSAIGAGLCANKAATAALLGRAGLPAPVHDVVRDLQAAIKAALEIGWPVVVKPLDRERGEGVAVDIRDVDQLKAAFQAACVLSRAKAVIVERQVDGVCHRLFVAQGRLLYAVKRLPMSIECDGFADITAAIDSEVARQLRVPPWDRSGIQPLDDLARTAIARAGFTPTSVPPKGTRVPTRRIESTDWGGVDEEVTLAIHPENLRVALAAGALFGLDMVGIDIITNDITRPWFENGAIINEVNFAPLLGGGDISRSHLPSFLNKFIAGTGTIPVEVFVGGEAAWAAATQRWQEMLASGLKAHISHEHQTFMPAGTEWHMPFISLYRRARALVMSAQVHALVLVVQTDELMTSGLPFEAVTSVMLIDRHLHSSQRSGEVTPPARVEDLLRLLRTWRKLRLTDVPEA